MVNLSDILLVFNGQQLDPTKEHELFTVNEFGFTVTEYTQSGEVRTYNNITEVHWLNENEGGRPMRAFESDIHGTGSCWYIEDKSDKTVIITESLQNYDEYMV